MTVPYSFATATAAIPLSQLDSNFNTAITLGNTAIQLGNTVTTLNNMTLANVTISSGNVTITNVSVTTANVTTVNATTVIATTANVTTANITTGNVTFANITGENVTTSNIATLTVTNNPTFSGGTANGVLYLNGSKVVTSGTALTFDGTNLGIGIASPGTKLDVGGPVRSNVSGGTPIFYLSNGTTQHSIQNNSGSLAFYNDGTRGMDLTSTGLGIGTSSPGQKLEVAGKVYVNTSAPQVILNRSGTTFQSDIKFQTSGTNNWSIGQALGVVGSNFEFYDYAAGITRLTLDTSGNLGLGVTPSAWTTFKALEVGELGGAFAAGGNNTVLTYNTYYSSGFKYARTGLAASYYQQASGYHAWYTAASGTAGNAITFTQAMTLDASGNLGVGTTSPSTRLHAKGATQLVRLQDDSAYIQFANTANTDTAYIQQTASVFNIISQVNGAMVLGTNSTERARITSGGYFKASNDGAYVNATGTYAEIRNTANETACLMSCSNTGFTSSVISSTAYPVAGTGFRHLVCRSDNGNDDVTYIRGDGNLYNKNGTYGTISDRKLKTDIVDAGSQWEDIKAVRFRKFKMINDPQQLVQLGVVAQELEQTSPSLVDETVDRDIEGNDLGTTTKSVKTSVLLLKAAVALQEAMARIEKLEAEVAKLKGA